MTITRPLGLRYPGVDLATWWPELDFRVEAQTGVPDLIIERSVETDTAFPVVAQRIVPVGRCSETDAANQLFHTRFFPVGRSEEVDQSNLVLVLQPGLGLVTRYVTIELSDKDRLTRREVHRDIVNYATTPIKITFVRKTVNDRISYSEHVDKIFFQSDL